MDCQNIVNRYIGWVSNNMSAQPLGHDCLITTPFVDVYGDFIEISAHMINDRMTFSDDGQTYDNLYEFGIDLHRLNPARRDAVRRILNSNQVKLMDGELISEAGGPADVGPALHRLLEAIQQINGIRMTLKHTIVRDFNLEVKNGLETRGLRYSSDFHIMGATKEHTFDFCVRREDALRLVRTISFEESYRARNSASLAAFMFMDLRRAKLDFSGILLLDDTYPDAINDEVTSIAREYSDRYFRWSNKDKFFEAMEAAN